MKFFPMVDYYGKSIAVSLEDISKIESDDYESRSKDPYICFTYKSGTSHHIRMKNGEAARNTYAAVIEVLNKPEA